METIAPVLNKWTLSVAAALLYHALNKLELLGEASDPRIEPIQSIVVGVLVLLCCYAAEWSWRRRGFLPNLILAPELPSSDSITGPAELGRGGMERFAASWDD